VFAADEKKKKTSRDGPIKQLDLDSEDEKSNPYANWCDNEFFFHVRYSKYSEKSELI